MPHGVYRFDRFQLDPANRQLRRDGAPIELNARYLDALTLLVSEPGRLVSKTRFMDEVWRGVPVTDEALTQCVRTLRRALGDDAARPRFIETAPKYGYRFICPVIEGEAVPAPSRPGVEDAAPAGPAASVTAGPSKAVLRLGLAGLAGGAAAGVLGGVFYGFVGVADQLEPGAGGASALLVIACLAMALGGVGGTGVALGVAAAVVGRPRAGGLSLVRGVLGGAIGGMATGAVVKLIGLDAFSLLFGQSPGPITGAMEGALLGAAVGVGAWLAHRERGASPPAGDAAAAALVAAVAGAAIPLLGGRMLGGSLDLLAQRFPQSHLNLAQLGRLFGETGFGLVSQTITAGIEALLFGGCIAVAMMIARKRVPG